MKSARGPAASSSSGPTLEREHALHAAGYARIAGVDEAGRGPLAGPVVAAAVVLPLDFDRARFALLNDSKQLSAAVREQLSPDLVAVAEWGIGVVEAAVIDRINIRQASWLAMQKAVDDLQTRFSPVDHALIDGLPYGPGPWPYEAVVKGDARSLSIAAASVIAKVWRDHLMQELDAQYPAYGFARHKGYPSPAHLRALDEHGPCAIHRQSYAPVRAVLDRRRSSCAPAAGQHNAALTKPDRT